MSIPFTPENATQAWDDLAARLDRFLASWEGGAEPLLTEYLPDEPEVHRRMVLVELVKIDLEQRTSRGQPKQLESYTAEFPELLENGEPPCELIYEEYHIRRGAGLTVTPQHYFERFPRSADALKRLMGTEGFSQTTQLVAAVPRMKGLGPGQTIDDFDLLVELGKGAFGSVFLARQISMNRLVALKVSADKGNEPRTLGQFDHPNIVRVFDQKRLTDRGLLLCYMTYAPGGTLAEVARKVRGTPAHARTGQLVIEAIDDSMQRAGQFTGEDSQWRKRMKAAPWPETICKIGVQLAQALDYAHKKGVLHRDVKPANVLLSVEGSPKLADFNISFNSQIEGATAAHYFGGSLAYMSPEQLEACNPAHERKPEDLDGRSDIFSLAVVLWELLHGERPFADEANGGWSVMLADMAVRRREDKPRPPIASSDPIAHRLELVLHKAMSPDPVQRYADGASMARELLLCLNPRAWDLTHNMSTGWRNFARRNPILVLTPLILLPILLASIFNYIYNENEFVHKQSDEVIRAFGIMFRPINLTLFPLGFAIVVWRIWPIASAMRRIVKSEPIPREQLLYARRSSLSLGRWVALVGLALWLAAGIAFPVGIHIISRDWSVQLYLHFIMAMTLSGLISCCFPFLATTWLSVRVFFPTLLASSAPEPEEQKQLLALSRVAGRYLVIAVVVPFLAILLLVMGGPEVRPYTIVLILGSILGFGAAYFAFQRIRADLASLTVATRSVELSSTHTDSVEVL